MSAPTYQEEKTVTPQTLQQVEEIYITSFPQHLLVPFAELTSELLIGNSRLFTTRIDDIPAAFTLTHPFFDDHTYFMTYMAVDNRQRGKGLGSGLLHYIIDTLCSEGITGLLWDVEAIEAGDTAARQEEHRRRIEFYRRLGAQTLDIIRDYRIVHYASTVSEPGKLMWMALDDQRPAPGGTLLKNMVEEAYRLHFGLDQRDPLVKYVVAGLGDS
jgi:GNAT superfamily N-acetyltransferase